MSKAQQNAAAKAAEKKVAEGKGVKARVLVACPFGNPNDVVIVNESQLENGKKDGSLDDDPAAVAYAESEGAKATDKTADEEPALEE